MALYSFASMLLVGAFCICLFFSLALLLHLYTLNSPAPLGPSERNGFAIIGFSPTASVLGLTLVYTLASAILLYAFLACDFRVEYVAQYSDRGLPLFYRITAFWAGQSGSMLFWAWSVALSGACFVLLKAYTKLGERSRLWFCLLFFCIMGFFSLILIVWSNPFDTLNFTPQDGQGLNPLLQNPGMIFHPPLLFLGYGGFVVPGCLALAQTLSGRLHDPQNGKRLEEHWGQASRPFILVAWALLTAGIVLGAWWAYMELGWGGYWAWDPVENASLIPWLIATAYLHTAVIGSRRGKLQRTNVFLMALTTISAFFATYLVRSGVIESLHAFGGGGVGTPLLIFTLASLYLALVIVVCEPGPAAKRPNKTLGMVATAFVVLCFAGTLLYGFKDMAPPIWLLGLFTLALLALPLLYKSPNVQARPLEDLTSREGLLLLVAWLLLAISFVILVATMWPVIITALGGIAPYLPESLSAKIPQKPMGLEPDFYNRSCLPLFALFAVLLFVCPWRKWTSGGKDFGFFKLKYFALLLIIALAFAALLYSRGITHPVALMAAAASAAAIVGLVFVFTLNKGLFKMRSAVAAHGVHLGLLLMVLGVAFSGPYQDKHTVELHKGRVAKLGTLSVLLNELYEGESRPGPDGKANYQFIEAELLVTDESGAVLGKLTPQRRLYSNFESQVYAEVSTLFSLGNEIYATLLGVDQSGKATLAVNVNPLVNWLWIGGTIMSLLPFLGLARVRRQEEDEG